MAMAISQVQSGAPTVIDLFCGLGGWAEGFIAEGYRCIGYDIEEHDYGTGGYPGTLILRDVQSITGEECKDAAVIVASPPCQEPSYRAMCWKRAKALTPKEVGLPEPSWWKIPEKASKSRRGMTTAEFLAWAEWKHDYPKPAPELFIALFNECFRIQREASEAAGRYIPLIVENVRGAQKWVGRARANYGSFYLWGDVGMVGRNVVPIVYGKLADPISARKIAKVSGFRFDGESHGSFQTAAVRATSGAKTPAGNCSAVLWKDREISRYAHPTPKEMEAHGFTDGRKVPGIKLSEVGFNVAAAQRYRESSLYADRDLQGTKQHGSGHIWYRTGNGAMSSKSDSRKAASAMIAKIPFPLAQHIARTFKPTEEAIA